MYTVYSKPQCSFCDQSKSLLKSRNLDYKEIIIDIGQPKESNKLYITASELKSKIPNARTVPQIYHEDTYLGGFLELKNHLQFELA